MSVRAADGEVGRMLSSHLLDGGHRRFACIGAAAPWAVVEQRYLGFNDVLRAHGSEPEPDLVRLEAGWEPASAVPLAQRRLRSSERPTAIMCCTDPLALRAIHTPLRLGLGGP